MLLFIEASLQALSIFIFSKVVDIYIPQTKK